MHATKSLLEEITERERERRRGLEAEVERMRELKRQKAEEIERFRRIKDDEELKVRQRQLQAQQEASRKREAQLEQEEREKEAVRRAHREGMECVLRDAKGEHGDFTVRVPLVDSVGYPTTISHLKSRVRAECFGQPPEEQQRLIHAGKPQSDAVKLIDLLNAHTPKTEPVVFFLVVSQKVTAPPARPPPPPAPPQPKPDAELHDPEAIVEVRVKKGLVGGDLVLQMKMKDSVSDICRQVVDRRVEPGRVQSGAASASPTLGGLDAAGMQLVMGGRILQVQIPKNPIYSDLIY